MHNIPFEKNHLFLIFYTKQYPTKIKCTQNALLSAVESFIISRNAIYLQHVPKTLLRQFNQYSFENINI